MNRVFKTKWSVARQEYVVTDEKHTTKSKTSKSAVALAVSALMMMAGGASATYLPGYMNDHLADHFASQSQTWETAEYQKDWGLTAMKSSSAYALGFTGKGVAVGVMDSGALLQKHPVWPAIASTPLKSRDLTTAPPATVTLRTAKIRANTSRAPTSLLTATLFSA